jgi:hypothetical protein
MELHLGPCTERERERERDGAEPEPEPVFMAAGGKEGWATAEGS